MFMKLDKTCTIESKLSTDGHHAITYGSPVTVSCNYKSKQEKNTDDPSIINSAWAILPPTTTVNFEDKITLDDGTVAQIMTIESIHNFRTKATEGIKVELGKIGGP